MYQRTTTTSRRNQRMLATNWLHVSQWFKATQTTSADGIVTMRMLPQIPHGSTYNVGRNRFKRACRTLRLSRVKVERKLRAGESAEYVMAQAGVL